MAGPCKEHKEAAYKELEVVGGGTIVVKKRNGCYMRICDVLRLLELLQRNVLSQYGTAIVSGVDDFLISFRSSPLYVNLLLGGV